MGRAGQTTENTIGAASQPVILSVAYPYAPVGARAVGGAEVILSQMEAALPSLGYRSLVIAHQDSTPAGQLLPTQVPDVTITDEVRALVEQRQQRNIDRAFGGNQIALVHMHGLDFERYAVPPGVPVLVTLHLPPAWYPERIWNLPSNYHLVCVSESQRRACPATARHRLHVVSNGVPLPPLRDPASRGGGGYALMLSRICPEKNLHTGLDAACLAGMSCILAGEVFPYESHRRYFDEQIAPRLDTFGDAHERRSDSPGSAPRLRFVGAVTGAAKARLLSRAACVLIPSLAPETSSLAAMEALAAGVPVVATGSGAIPEVVDDGRTGFVINPAADFTPALAAALRRLPELDRDVCRRTAEERFGLDRMLQGYATLYAELARVPQRSVVQQLPASAEATRPPLIAELVRDDADLAALRPAWEQLWQSDARATPFQHPAWLLPWWRQFGPEGQLQTIAVRTQAGALAGLLPLYVYPESESAQRKLLFAGAGTTDYLDGLFAPEVDPEHTAAAAMATALRLPSWDSLALTQIVAHSPLLRSAAPEAAGDLPLVHEPTESCSGVSTRRPLPSKLGANVRRYRRRAAEVGALAFGCAESTSQALQLFEELVELHHRRWLTRGEPGIFHDARVVAHHRQAIPLLIDAGMLRLFRLSLGEKTLAVLYALADGSMHLARKLYLYAIGLDPGVADLSPGTLLLHEVWTYAEQNGFEQLDLLRGGEAYKQLWGAEALPTFGLFAQRQPAQTEPAVEVAAIA